MLRILEIAWLCIAIFSFGAATFQFFTEGISSAAFMLIVTVGACFMYVIRKKQRMKFDRHRPKEDPSAHYH